MNSETSITYAAIAIIVISLASIGMQMTGFAVTPIETGYVNVTVNDAGSLNFTTIVLDFGTGSVDAGPAGATLNSSGAGYVLNGSWTPVGGELVLQNIGNVNVSLNLTANDTAANWMGAAGATFKALVANAAGNTTACTGTQAFQTSYADIDTTDRVACSIFNFAPGYNTIDIDFELYIPSSVVGTRTVEIKAVGYFS